jgi:hypothetical protein
LKTSKFKIMTNKIHPVFSKRENKSTDILVNLFLLAGISVLVFTLFYILFHLDKSDEIIYKCIPGFVIGLFSVVVYLYNFKRKPVYNKRIHL